MRPSQIIAIDRVMMEAPPAAKARLVWFYRDVVGLTFVEELLNPSLLRFGSSQLELRIALLEEPRLEAGRRKALLSVRSIDQTAKVLDEEQVPYQRLSGWGWSDRRLSLLDPAGNRVELKQEWRPGVFPSPGEQARQDRQTDRQQGAGGPSKNFKKGGDTAGEAGYSG